MNKRIAFILVLALTGALASGGIVAAQADKDWAGPYAVRMTASAGGGYSLDGGSWQVRGAASAPGYHLEGAAPFGTGTPCCCASLPCVLRHYP